VQQPYHQVLGAREAGEPAAHDGHALLLAQALQLLFSYWDWWEWGRERRGGKEKCERRNLCAIRVNALAINCLLVGGRYECKARPSRRVL
jgi:hypothetical protein